MTDGNNQNRSETGTDVPGAGVSGGWLSSNMTQLMVFLNGLILTVTAFATLSVFIQEMVADGLVRTTEETRERIDDHFKDVRQTVRAVGSFITLSTDLEEQRILEVLRGTDLYADLFDRLFWLQKQEDGKWVVHTLLLSSGDAAGSDGYTGWLPDSRFAEYILAQNVRQDEPFRFLLSPAGTGWVQAAEEPQTYVRPFGVIHSILRDGERTDIIAGFGRIDRAFPEEWLAKRPSVMSIRVAGVRGGTLLYDLRRVSQDGRAMKDGGFSRAFDMSFGGADLQVETSLMMDTRESFLEKIPFLMLLFGMTLTLIGTLYVRSNQRQSSRLAAMNRELSHKNNELGYEISERERLNQALRKAERENRAVIDSVSDIIFELSTGGTILFLNRTWRKVTGFETDMSMGQNLFDMLHTQDQEEQRKNFSDLVNGDRQAYRVFTRLRISDGTFRSVEMAVSMLRRDEAGNLRVVGTITDVEERRRAELALGEAEKKYRNIVENSSRGIYQMMPDGQFLSANPALAKILGYGAPEDILRDVGDARSLVYIDAQQREKFLRTLLPLDTPRTFEGRVRRKDGTVIWVSDSVRAVKDGEGVLLYYEGGMDDITKRKEAEIALKQAKIESDLSARAKSEFLANMSHELRTPLNAVIGFSEILKDEVFGPLGSKEYTEYSQEIYESGRKLLNVINDILDVSRIEAGERQLNEGVVDLKRVVESCLELMAPRIEANAMEINNRITDKTPRLIGEMHAVMQMLSNLLSNAIKFTPSGGMITLATETTEDGRLRVSVTDTGIGLTDDEIEKALSPFGQVDTEHNRTKSGTGLGLTLVRALVRMHGGEFELFSQKGVGTTATLIFPARRVSLVDSDSVRS